MGLYMRAVVRDWTEPSFDDLVTFVASDPGGFSVAPTEGAGWADFEIQTAQNRVVLPADLIVGETMREELEELADFLEDHTGTPAALQTVRDHLATASAIVGLQILMSSYDESVAAANLVIAFLEQSPGVLTQVDTVGWYNADDLILKEAGS